MYLSKDFCLLEFNLRLSNENNLHYFLFNFNESFHYENVFVNVFVNELEFVLKLIDHNYY